MKFTVSLTLSIDAFNKLETFEEYLKRIKNEAFDKDSIEVEIEA